MEDNKKAVTVSFLVIGGLVFLVTMLLMQFLAQSFATVARIESNDYLSTGIPVTLGIIVFAALQFNTAVVTYMDGVVGELRKVVWPSRKDTSLMTVVVVITLILSGVIVGVYDSVWAYLINYFIK